MSSGPKRKGFLLTLIDAKLHSVLIEAKISNPQCSQKQFSENSNLVGKKVSMSRYGGLV